MELEWNFGMDYWHSEFFLNRSPIGKNKGRGGTAVYNDHAGSYL